MPKRKYTRRGDVAVAHECCNRKCKWQGFDKQKSLRKEPNGFSTHICPECGNDEFYGLLELPEHLKS